MNDFCLANNLNSLQETLFNGFAKQFAKQFLSGKQSKQFAKSKHFSRGLPNSLSNNFCLAIT